MISIWDGDGRAARSPAYEAALRDLLRSGRLIVAHAAADAARLELDEVGAIRRIALPPYGPFASDVRSPGRPGAVACVGTVDDARPDRRDDPDRSSTG